MKNKIWKTAKAKNDKRFTHRYACVVDKIHNKVIYATLHDLDNDENEQEQVEMPLKLFTQNSIYPAKDIRYYMYLYTNEKPKVLIERVRKIILPPKAAEKLYWIIQKEILNFQAVLSNQ